MGFIYNPSKATSGSTPEEIQTISQQTSIEEIVKKMSETYVAASALSADSIVYINDDNKVDVMSCANADLKGKVCGIVLSSANIDEEVDVYMSGEVTLSSPVLPNKKILVGKNGEIVTDINVLKSDADVKFFQIFGRSIKSDKIVIDIKPAVWK